MSDTNERSVASDGYAMLPTGFKAWAKTLCDQINETGLAHAANYIGLAIALMEKGIISKDELEAARAKASVMVNHHCVTLRDEQSKETLETLRKLFREEQA